MPATNEVKNPFNNDTTTTLLNHSKNIPKVKGARRDLINFDVFSDLNTYYNFGIFPTYSDTYAQQYESKDSKKQLYKYAPGASGTPGVRSIFNPAGAIVIGTNQRKFNRYFMRPEFGEEEHTSYWRIANNVPLMDSPKARQRIRASAGCSVKELVHDSQAGLMGKETYAYSDFMYCKHLGKVSNNYMITLRRFPVPVDDYIGAFGQTSNQRKNKDTKSKNSTCTGCMVTWIGVSGNEMQNILKYNYKQPFKELEATWEQAEVPDADAGTGILGGLFSVFDSQYRAQYQTGMASSAANGVFSHMGIHLGDAPYKHLANRRDERTKVWGPIDSIRHVYYRDDKGLTFEQKFSIVFEYELRSYNGINGKQAMLDLISNILNVTYTTGSFWGGGYRGYGAHQSNVFANLNIFKTRGGFTNFIDAFAKDVQTLSNKITNYFADDPGKALLKLLNDVGGMIMSGLLNKLGRPQKGFYNALLSPAPVGMWHVTIGNPKRPIMSMGNMIITNVQFEHNGPLGIDDFPTGIKVTVDLDRGKARDLRDIERLYMQGNDRIYSSMSEKVLEMYKNATKYKGYTTDVFYKGKKNGYIGIAESNVDNSDYSPGEDNNGKSSKDKFTFGTGQQYNEPDHERNSKGEIIKSDYIRKEGGAPVAPSYMDGEVNLFTINDEKNVDQHSYIKTNYGDMNKYFGTYDLYSIYVPAAEQEYGSAQISEKQREGANKWEDKAPDNTNI